MFEPGRYFGTLKEWGFSKSKSTQSPQIHLVFDITHRQAGDQWQALHQSAERTIFWSLSGGAKEYTIEKMGNIGYDGNDLPQSLRTEGIALDCNHETYQGKTRERWDTAYGGAGAPEYADDVARDFRMEWKSTHASKPAGRPAPPKASSQQAPAGVSSPVGGEGGADDDIPFD